MLSDYNCKIFESNKYDLLFNDYRSPELELAEIASDIQMLGVCGFHRLICLIDHRADNSAAQTISAVHMMRRKFNSIIRGDSTKISFNPSIFISEDILNITNIKSLAIPRSDYIFVRSPIPEMPDYYPTVINKLLYSLNLIPIFSDFHICNMLYPSNELEKLLRIPKAAFQFNIGSINLSENISTVKKILKNGNTVLLGTGCTHSNLNKAEILKSLDDLRRSLNDEEYMTLVIRSHKFPM
jgi:hypothetical protein